MPQYLRKVYVHEYLPKTSGPYITSASYNTRFDVGLQKWLDGLNYVEWWIEEVSDSEVQLTAKDILFEAFTQDNRRGGTYLTLEIEIMHEKLCRVMDRYASLKNATAYDDFMKFMRWIQENEWQYYPKQKLWKKLVPAGKHGSEYYSAFLSAETLFRHYEKQK